MAAGSRLLPMAVAVLVSSSRFPSPMRRQVMSGKTVIHVVDDDAAMRDSLAFLLDVNGFQHQTYESANALLSAVPDYRPWRRAACRGSDEGRCCRFHREAVR